MEHERVDSFPIEASYFRLYVEQLSIEKGLKFYNTTPSSFCPYRHAVFVGKHLEQWNPPFFCDDRIWTSKEDYVKNPKAV